MMDIQLIESFLVVCEEQNLSRAAVRLFRTQSSVTRQIQALEALLGVTLFERSTRGVKPTPQGEELRARGTRILGELRGLKNMVSGGEGPDGELHIACSDNVASHFLAPVLGRFARQCPRVRIQLVNGFTPGITNLVERGRCELGFVPLPLHNPRLELTPVLRYHHVAVFPPKGCPKDVESISLKVLAQMPLVLLPRETSTRRSFDEMMNAKGLQVDRVLEVGSIAVQKSMIRAGLGVGILPGYTLERQDNLPSLPIMGAKLKTLACCRLRNKAMSLPAVRFVESLGAEN